MKNFTFPRVLSYASILLGLGLLVHALLPRGEATASASQQPVSTWVDSQSQQPVKLGTQAIETIQVGQRVISDDPTLQLDNATSIDPATWRKLRLTAVWVWEDGTRDDWEVVTLQPLAWIEQHQLTVGSPAPIPLDLEEMGAPDDLRATVAAIEPCPVLATGPGRVVLTTVNHLNPAIHELTFRDAQQQQTSVQTTRFHKFFKPQSQTWHSTFELHPGDVLGGLHGDLTIVGNRELPGVKRVYNLTVEGEHVYHVTKLGLLAHNNGCGTTPLTKELKDKYREAARDIWQSKTGRRAIWDNMDVHHRIPLEYSHLFPEDDPNIIANLVGVKGADHNAISNAWTQFRNQLNGRVPTSAEVMQQALRIDEQFSSTMKFLP